MPERIQRKRTKGWRMPQGAIYVGRPTKWGNPYQVHEHTDSCGDQWLCPLWCASSRADAVRKYRHALIYPVHPQPWVPGGYDIQWELRGHDLACWCPLVDEHGNHVPCHADVLLELANGEA